MKYFKKMARAQRGATMIEYAIMVSLIAVVSIATIKALGADVNTIFDKVKSMLVTTT